MNAAGDVFNPDVEQRRDWARQIKRREKIEKRERDEAARASTGIRVQRERPVFTTPNVIAPAASEQIDVDGDAEFRELLEPRHCYVCKEPYGAVHPFYDQLCQPCGDFNFTKRTETADLTGRVALLTGGRVKIGYQAGIKLLRAGAQLIVTTRFPRDSAARYAQEPDFADWWRPARDLRPRPAPHAERRGVLPAPARDPRPARLHRQQRVPDGAAPARLLPSHARARDGIAAARSRPRRSSCSVPTRACAATTCCSPTASRWPSAVRRRWPA